MIKTDVMLNLLRSEIASFQAKHEEYKKYNVIITTEQQFVKIRESAPTDIFAVIKFESSTIYFGQTVYPCELRILGEKNKVEEIYNFILAFEQEYNLVANDDKTITQVFSTPSVASNFNDIEDGFRPLLTCGISFVVSESSNPIQTVTYSWTTRNQEEKSEIIYSLGTMIQFSNSLDSQPFYHTDDFTTSMAKAGSLVVSLSIYQTQCHLLEMIFAIINRSAMKKVDDTSFNGIDTAFNLTFTFKDGTEINGVFRISNYSLSQQLAQLPVASLSFTN
jgi:hypothetical protein